MSGRPTGPTARTGAADRGARRRSGWWLVAGAAGALGLPVGPTAGAQSVAPPVPPASAPPVPGARVVPAVDSLWRLAVGRGTRRDDGRPGPRGWTQTARYRLQVTLDPPTARVTGRGALRYVNRSPDTLRTIVLQLAQNLFAKGAPSVERVPVTGGVTLDGLCVARAGGAAWRGAALRHCASDSTAVRDGALRIDGTVATLPLARPLAPGDSLELLARWRFTLPPRSAPRMGHDGTVFMLGYWYPQFAVYDDVVGWQADPYLATGEFYMDPADYDVTVVVPSGMLVASSGTLRNAAEVLAPAVRDRLARARGSLSPIAIVAEADRRAGPVTATTPTVAWRFTATQQRDFAVYASAAVVWDAGVAVVPRSDTRGMDTVLVQALYRPSRRHWRRATDYLRVSVELFSRVLWPYPGRQMTAVEGIVDGGMEYPALTIVQGATPRELFTTIAHETAHMWFPMDVGSDERRFAWMDEGIASWLERVALRAETGRDDDPDGVPELWRMLVRDREEESVLRPADGYGSLLTYTVAAYERPVVAFRAFAEEYGDSALVTGLRRYGEAWRGGRHPYPPDFVRLVFAAAGDARDVFAREWLYGTGYLDLRIEDGRTEGDTLVVRVRSVGGATLSSVLVATRVDGTTVRVPVPAAALRAAGDAGLELAIPEARTVRALQLDPDKRTPDLDRGNDRWPRR